MGDVTVEPLSGLATVIFDAKADWAKISGESDARSDRTKRRVGVWPEQKSFVFIRKPISPNLWAFARSYVTALVLQMLFTGRISKPSAQPAGCCSFRLFQG